MARSSCDTATKTPTAVWRWPGSSAAAVRLLLVILGTATCSSVLLAATSSATVVAAEGRHVVVEPRTLRRAWVTNANTNADATSSSSSAGAVVRGSRSHRRLGKDKEVDSGVGGGQPPPPTTTTSEPTAAPIPAPAPPAVDPGPAPAPTKKPSSGSSSNGGSGNNGGGSSGNNNGTETPPASNSTSSEGGGETGAPITVDLLEFTVTYDATDSTTPEEVVASINATLFDGFKEAYPTLLSVLVEEPDSKRWRVLRLRHEPQQQQHEQQHSAQWRHLVSAELTLGGQALFEGTAPESSGVQALQTSLLQQWQGGTVSVEAAAAQAPTGGGSSSSSAGGGGASAGLIGGIVAAVAVVVLLGAAVATRYGRRRRVQQERGNDSGSGNSGARVEILSEVQSDDGDEWGTLKAGRTLSTEHAECDIEIEDRNGDVTVTTSPTSGGSKRERKAAASQPPAEPHPDSVYLDEAATAASDSVDSREDRAALGSLLKFFKAQSDCCPPKSQATEVDLAVKNVEESEEKKDDDADEAPRSPTHKLPPSIAPMEFTNGTAVPAILPAPSGDSMDDYSLASTSFGPKIPALPATKWMESTASPAREEYHSDNESQFTYGDVASPSVASGPTVPPPTGGNLLGPPTRRYRALSSDDDNDSIDAIMGVSVNAASTSPSPSSRTPTRTQKLTSKASPTSILSPLSATGSPASTASSMSTSPAPKKGPSTQKPKQLWPQGDDAQPFDEVLEDEHDLDGFTAELERSQSRFAHPEFSPPRVSSAGRQGDPPAPKAGHSVGTAATAPAARQPGQPLRGTGSFSSAAGGEEETLSSYLRTKRGEAREQRTFL